MHGIEYQRSFGTMEDQLDAILILFQSSRFDLVPPLRQISHSHVVLRRQEPFYDPLERRLDLLHFSSRHYRAFKPRRSPPDPTPMSKKKHVERR